MAIIALESGHTILVEDSRLETINSLNWAEENKKSSFVVRGIIKQVQASHSIPLPINIKTSAVVAVGD